MQNQRTQETGERLRAAQELLMKQLAWISEAQFHQARAEGEWSPAQVVAHVCESPSLNIANVRKMAAEDNPAVGRTPEDVQARLQALADHARDSLGVALDRLSQANAEVLKTVASLSDEQLERRGIHSSWGVVTIQVALDKLASHYEEHARQLASILEG